ncbi:MAG TPA: alpha/beta fold hydrolase [Chitinophaga sp.]|uniref:thioesterase II family protein n=1 Tax=Chitinophaga sp. TaxID=1869181 RepID=UPI002B540C9C|nr:alpha/beta fold hydrolase [Chitinophaga sp.]HVI48829.1 alpha/beta fold hydrolase [Chitinophaga sp.]
MKKPQLFTLHFAGGNCYSFQFLTSKLPALEVISLELPGRGNRMMEDLIHGFEQAADDLFKKITARLNGEPFLIYGHSMGAVLGIKVAHLLEQSGRKPAALILSGNAGPGVKKYDNTYLQPTPEFKKVLKDLGGIPDEVLDNEDLFSFFEPVLRADFEIVEKAGKHAFSPVSIPLYAVMGTAEECVDKIDTWQQYTTSRFRKELLEGGHFFIHQHAPRMAAIIMSQLQAAQVAR